jgi:hypothetical protein
VAPEFANSTLPHLLVFPSFLKIFELRDRQSFVFFIRRFVQLRILLVTDDTVVFLVKVVPTVITVGKIVAKIEIYQGQVDFLLDVLLREERFGIALLTLETLLTFPAAIRDVPYFRLETVGVVGFLTDITVKELVFISSRLALLTEFAVVAFPRELVLRNIV